MRPLALDVQDRLARFVAPEESSPVTLRQVLDQMLGAILGNWLTILRDTGAPPVFLRKYEGAIKALEDDRLPLRQRARDAERLVREIINAAAWYYKGDQTEFREAKAEAMRTCALARRVLGGQRLEVAR